MSENKDHDITRPPCERLISLEQAHRDSINTSYKIESYVSKIDDKVENLKVQVAESFNQFSNKLTDSAISASKTNWTVIIGWLMFILAIGGVLSSVYIRDKSEFAQRINALETFQRESVQQSALNQQKIEEVARELRGIVEQFRQEVNMLERGIRLEVSSANSVVNNNLVILERQLQELKEEIRRSGNR